jgi:predicted O-linked N-acetylglucosamine transferase (SPINDLY family)
LLHPARDLIVSGGAEFIASCRRAVAVDPQSAEAHFNLGKACLDQARHEEAATCFRQAVALAPEYGAAWYHLGLTHSLLREFPAAIACGQRVLEIDPGHAEACNNIGYCHLVQGQLEAAALYFQRAVAARPDYINAHYNLGMTLLRQGRAEAALPALQAALALRPEFPEALLQLGVACLNLGRWQESADHLRRAAALRPGEAEIYYNLGYACSRLGDSGQALACYRKALELNPDFIEVHYNLGTLHADQGRYEEAIAALGQVLRWRPDHLDALINTGTAYLNLRRIDEAVPYYQRALALRPDNIQALYNLGTAFLNQGRLMDAASLLQRAVAASPDYVEAAYNLGNVYNDMFRFDEARTCYERVLALQADFVPALVNLGNVLLALGLPGQAIAYYDRALALQPAAYLAHHARLLAMNYLYPPATAELWAAHRRFGAQFETEDRPRPRHANPRDPARRLKIGYVSPDLRLHSVGFFMEPILAHHDHNAVEIYCYYNHTWRDAVSERLRSLADHWIPCRELDDEALAARIRADGIDILVDLAGHTRDNRLLVFAHKPAPVQVSYLGYPATTGLQAMDWRLVTAETDPEGAEQWHSERLYRLPRSLWCYRPPATAGEVQGETPARAAGFITFGSMNNIAKVSEAAVATWSGILKRVPGSRLVLTNLPEGEGTAQIARRFAAQGIAEERLVLQGKLSAEAYEAQLQKIDLGLDPYPYNGTTTTCQSLWMGIPVITLEGETSVARSGYALLQTLGLEELIARDEAEYVEIATRLANDLDRLDALRSGMRSRFEASALRDETGFTREIEDAYRAIWRDWCGKEGSQ